MWMVTSFSLKNRGEGVKKLWVMILVCALMLHMLEGTLYAEDGGEMGSFGGISEGKNLPYTMDKYVVNGLKPQTVFAYKEVVFLSGTPVEFTGTITIVKGAVDYVKKPTGTYNETYTVKAENKATSATLTRAITFLTSYRVVEGEFKKQIVRSSRKTKWTESVTVGGKTYKLDETSSTYSKSSIEDLTPGVSYYNTTLSYLAKYTTSDTAAIVQMVDGNINGYSQPWSKVEAQDLTIQISDDGGANFNTVIHLKPFLEAKKTLYFDETDPFAISFAGTYNQRMERESTLSYEILSTDLPLTMAQKNGSSIIKSANEVEKLPIPENLDFIEGHWAEEDLKKLYSMEIFTEIPHQGMQVEAMPRGEFIKALCLAMNISTLKYEDATKNTLKIFGDVPTTHPLYKYIMAAYDAKLIKGIGEEFNIDVPITRQEAFTIYIRVIGLERLGITDSPQTPFVDDGKIAAWAKKEIMAGFKLGIIKGDQGGNVQPTKWMSKAESAAIINRLIDYLREEISQDYRK